MPSIVVPDLPEAILQTIARRATEAQRSLQDEIRLALVRAYRDPRVFGQQVWMELQREKLLKGKIPRIGTPVLDILRDLRQQRDVKIMSDPTPDQSA